MDIVLSHTTALEFWRSKRSSTLARVRPKGISVLPSCAPSGAEIEALPLRLEWVPLAPFHVLVKEAAARRRGKRMTAHVCSSSLPEGSLVKVAEGVFVCSPELCFQQLASVRSFSRLVEIGFEFCGSYSRYSGRTGFYERRPLTNVKAIERLLRKTAGTKGSTLAANALRHVLEGSWSPMETIMTMLLCLPMKKGGYGLPTPSMNYRIDVSSSARKFTPKGYFVCDAYWAAAKLDVEYDSNEHHLKRKEKANDSARRNALSAMGISVIVVTWDQVVVRRSMDEVASSIARKLGRRLRLERVSGSRAQLDLRRELLSFADWRTCSR